MCPPFSENHRVGSIALACPEGLKNMSVIFLMQSGIFSLFVTNKCPFQTDTRTQWGGSEVEKTFSLVEPDF